MKYKSSPKRTLHAHAWCNTYSKNTGSQKQLPLSACCCKCSLQYMRINKGAFLCNLQRLRILDDGHDFEPPLVPWQQCGSAKHRELCEISSFIESQMVHAPEDSSHFVSCPNASPTDLSQDFLRTVTNDFKTELREEHHWLLLAPIPVVIDDGEDSESPLVPQRQRSSRDEQIAQDEMLAWTLAAEGDDYLGIEANGLAAAAPNPAAANQPPRRPPLVNSLSVARLVGTCFSFGLSLWSCCRNHNAQPISKARNALKKSSVQAEFDSGPILVWAVYVLFWGCLQDFWWIKRRKHLTLTKHLQISSHLRRVSFITAVSRVYFKNT